MNRVKRHAGVLATCVVMLGALNPAWADEHQPPPVAEIWEECAGCHGEHGEGDADMGAPRLNGQHDWYVLAQLKNFRDELRGVDDENDPNGNMMMAMAQAIEHESSLTEIANFIGKMPVVAAAKTVKGGNPKAGGEIYQANCTFCHGQDGGGNRSVGAPRLAGQSDWYIVQQLNNFRAGIRGVHKADERGGQMQSMTILLPDETAVSDIAAFISQMD